MSYRKPDGRVGAFHAEGSTLQCDMDHECRTEVAMIEAGGWVYCVAHGVYRRSGGRRVRMLRPHELNRLRRGQQLTSY